MVLDSYHELLLALEGVVQAILAANVLKHECSGVRISCHWIATSVMPLPHFSALLSALKREIIADCQASDLSDREKTRRRERRREERGKERRDVTNK
jgi:hypothetical protein